MDTFLLYILKISVCIFVFYLLYILQIRNRSSFAACRTYLISTGLLSFILPAIHFRFTGLMANIPDHVLLETVDIISSPITHIIGTESILRQILLSLYFAGAAFFITRFLLRLIHILQFVIKHGIENYGDKSIVVIQTRISPFSFFNLIFISEEEKRNPQLRDIIEHEQAHINNYHSVDIVLIELAGIVLWFNPVVWAYKKSLQSVHEYQADNKVLENGNNIFQYQKTLFTQSIGIPYNSIVNSFNQSLLKKRLIMMKKEKPARWTSFRLLIAVPVILLFMFIFNNMNGISTPDFVENFPVVVKDTIKNNQEKDVYHEVEVMPVFSQGGENGLMNYIASNVKYPEKSRKEGIEAKVYVQFTVDKDGKVIDVTEKKTIAHKTNDKGKSNPCKAPELTKEALRVISSLPEFTPGYQKGKAVKVLFTVPINFKLDSKKKKK